MKWSVGFQRSGLLLGEVNVLHLDRVIVPFLFQTRNVPLMGSMKLGLVIHLKWCPWAIYTSLGVYINPIRLMKREGKIKADWLLKVHGLWKIRLIGSRGNFQSKKAELIKLETHGKAIKILISPKYKDFHGISNQ